MDNKGFDSADAGSSSSQQYRVGSWGVVETKNVWFLYGAGDDAAGLKGVDMTVQQSTIYALLGASGCGKSTLISVLVGLRKPQQGQVEVFGSKPSSRGAGVPGPWVGFMPQETCLLDELTIEETLTFFSTLNHVPKAIQPDRIKELKQLLDLPDDRLSKCLSGGQKRRLSLAAALVHNPPLIVLDEPTVGADPILRTRIWRHLRSLVEKQGKTVVMSTHYIEEARAADKVGLMREGVILTEESPSVLLTRFSACSLEEVFLKVCIDNELSKSDTRWNLDSYKDKTCLQEMDSTAADVTNLQEVVPTKSTSKTDENEVHTNPNETSERGNEINKLVDPEIGSDNCGEPKQRSLRQTSDEESHLRHNLRAPTVSHHSSRSFLVVVFGIAWKNITLLRRNIVFLLITFILPISNFLLIQTSIGHLPFDLSVAVASSEGENLAKNYLLRNLESGRFNIIHLRDVEEAIGLVRSGQACAAVHIPDEFSVNMFKRIRLAIHADNKTIEKSRIHLYLDNSNLVIGSTVYVSLLQSFLGIVKELGQMIGLEPAVVELPLQFQPPVLGKADIELNHVIVLAVLPETLYFMSMILAALVFVNDRANGFLSRCQASGMGSVQIISAHFVVQNLVLIFQICSIAGLLYGSGVEVHGSYLVLLLIFVVSSYLGMAVGITISVLASSIHVVMLLVVLFHLLTAGVAGVFWPIEALPPACSWLSTIHPQTWLIQATRKVVDNGIGLENTLVWSSCLYSLFFSCLFLALSTFMYQDDKLAIVESIMSFRVPYIFRNKVCCGK